MAEKWEPRNSRNIGTQLNELLELHCNCSSTLAILKRYAGKEGTGLMRPSRSMEFTWRERSLVDLTVYKSLCCIVQILMRALLVVNFKFHLGLSYIQSTKLNSNKCFSSGNKKQLKAKYTIPIKLNLYHKYCFQENV